MEADPWDKRSFSAVLLKLSGSLKPFILVGIIVGSGIGRMSRQHHSDDHGAVGTQQHLNIPGRVEQTLGGFGMLGTPL